MERRKHEVKIVTDMTVDVTLDEAEARAISEMGQWRSEASLKGLLTNIRLSQVAQVGFMRIIDRLKDPCNVAITEVDATRKLLDEAKRAANKLQPGAKVEPPAADNS